MATGYLLTIAVLLSTTHVTEAQICNTTNHCDCYSNYQECYQKQVTCTGGNTCNVYCGVGGGCQLAIINCYDGVDCNIYCDHSQSCLQAVIHGNNATNLNIYTGTNFDSHLRQATVYCPISAAGQCNIDCGTRNQNCQLLDIKAENSNFVDLKCGDTSNNLCNEVKVYCPRVGICNIHGVPTTNGMTNMRIYSEQGYNNVFITGTETSISIGSIYCTFDYGVSCQIDSNDNNACTTTASDKTCDRDPTTANPTAIPTTIAPTLPTANPTTGTPTSATPTTSIPTTSEPTTSAPTTFIPTTFIPTTSIPTTSVPTTLNPISTDMQTTISTQTTSSNNDDEDYTVTIEIEDAEQLSAEELDTIVGEILDADPDIIDAEIVSVDGDTIIIAITSDDELDTDEIEEIVSENLQDKYPDIKVTVSSEKDNEESGKPNSLDSQVIVALIIIGVIILLIVILGVIYCLYKKKQMNTNDNVDDMIMEANSKSTVNPMNEGEDVNMVATSAEMSPIGTNDEMANIQLDDGDNDNDTDEDLYTTDDVRMQTAGNDDGNVDLDTKGNVVVTKRMSDLEIIDDENDEDDIDANDNDDMYDDAHRSSTVK